ncbi:MAG: type IV pilus assembly protein PilM [Nitrospirae bacterium]|nr:type IV pilus assembly protein PilM [Nitrospirota bacterium]
MGIRLDLSFFRRPVVGLDIGSSSIKVVLLDRSSGGIRLAYAGLAEIRMGDSEDKISDTLMGLFDEGRIKKERIGAVFTTYTPTIRYLTLPKMPKDELSEAVKWEASKIINFPMEGMIIDFLMLGEVDDKDIKKYELLIVAVEKDTILGNIDLFKKSGIHINLLTVNPLSLLNIVKRNYKAHDGNVVYVDIGASKTDINVSKKGVLKFTRNVQLGGRNITRAVEEMLGLSYDEAEAIKKEKGIGLTVQLQLRETTDINKGESEVIKPFIDNFILEIQRSIDYYRAQFREGTMQKIILSGGTALMPGFKEYLSTFFDIPVVIDNPFFNISYRNDIVYDLEVISPRFSTAVGTAIGLLK